MSLQPGTFIGKYVVRRKLAEGGMAEIYLCSVRGPEGFEKDVVIKRIRSFLSDDPQFVEMFIAEARLASRLNHANVVQIFDFDKHEDSFYLAMEYVRGKSLWDLRRRSRELMMPLPPTLVAHIGSEVARGLHYAHRLTERGKPLGLVHRDVTPHNVLLSFEGAVKLADFGIAKAGNKLTSPGMLKGKFAYMAPEQARGDDVDARTDVFALGIVLWEMLTGARLFDGDSDVAVLKAVQQSVIASPARLNPDVHSDLDAVVMRALERDPQARHQTAQELERALGQFILRNADSIEETDVGGFLRRLYADELQHRDGIDGTTSGVRSPSSSVPREPTAVMSGTGKGQTPSISQPVSPDEDVHASTWVVKRGAASAGAVDPALRPTLPAQPLLLTNRIDATAAPRSTASPAPPQPQGQEQLPAQPSPTKPAAPIAPAAPMTAGDSTAVLQARVRRGRASRIGLVAGGVLAIASAAAVVTVRSGEGKSKVADASVVAARAETIPSEPAPEVAPLVAATPSPSPVEPDSGLVVSGTDDAGVAVVDEPPEEAAPTPARVPAPGGKKPNREHRTADRAPGTIVLNVTPWANVYIDGEKHGDVAGQHEFQLAPGRYHIRFEHPRKTDEKVVTVRSNRRQLLTFDLFRE